MNQTVGGRENSTRAQDDPGDLPRVVILMPSFRGGGVEGAMVRLANHLSAHGNPVDIVVLQDEGPWQSRLVEDVRVVDLDVARAAYSLGRLVRYLRRSQPALILSNVSHINVIAVLAHRLAGSEAKLMLLEHNHLGQRLGQVSDLFRMILTTLIRLTYPSADLLLAVSKGVAVSVGDTLRIPSQEIGLLPNGISMDEVIERAKEPVLHPWIGAEGPPVILAAGRLVRQKGFSYLLKAISLLIRETPAKLIILGDGPLRKDLESLADALNISDHVDFPGFQPNPYAFMSKASVFVLASIYEGFGIVILEAMTCNTPVVATDCPSGPRELLADGEAGLLVPVRDPEALYEAIRRMLTDEDLAAEYRHAARKRASMYDMQSVGEIFRKIAVAQGILLR